MRTTQTPIAGTASLQINLSAYNNAWWSMNVGAGLNNASALTVSGALKPIAVVSTSPLQYCASILLYDRCVRGAVHDRCTNHWCGADGARVLPLDITQTLASIHIHLKNRGGSSLQYLLDSASADLTLSGAAALHPNRHSQRATDTSPTPTHTTSADRQWQRGLHSLVGLPSGSRSTASGASSQYATMRFQHRERRSFLQHAKGNWSVVAARRNRG